MLWLIDSDARAKVEQAIASQIVASAEQSQAFAAAASQPDMPRNMRVSGATAKIEISGVLVPKLDFLLWIFGIEQTTYADIMRALSLAEEDADVERIELRVNSPGGAVDGMFDTLAALEAASKPITVRARLAASAAYGLAAAAGPIHAESPASTFGSVGVAVSLRVNAYQVDITSTEAPDKRPDPSTQEGKAVIRRHLDAVHDLFVGAIARGRGTTDARVNAEFGRGAVMLSAEAQSRGLIDSYPGASTATGPTTRAASARQTMETRMTLEELRAQHPALVTALLEQGRAEGATGERRRCLDHLLLGAAADVPQESSRAIAEGLSVNDMQATYMAAHMKRTDIAAAAADGEAASQAAGGTTVEPEADTEEKVHELVIAQLKGGV